MARARPGAFGALVLLGAIAACEPASNSGGDSPATARSTARSTPSREVPAVPAADLEPQVLEALDAARARVVADPASADAWGGYAILLDAHEFFPAAVASYAAARELAPDTFDWLYLHARVTELAGGEPEEFLSGFREAVGRSPAYVPGRVRYGEALLRAGQTAAAESVFAAAAALEPGLAAAHRGQGRALLAEERPEEAVRALERAVAIRPEDGAAWSFLAQAFARTGERERAREAQSKSRELDPVHTYPDPVLARVGDAGLSANQCQSRAVQRLRRGEFASAVRDLEIAKRARPDDGGIAGLLGGAYAGVGRTAEARAEFERALAIRPEATEVRRDYAALLLRLREPGPAAAEFARVEAEAGPSRELTAQKATALAQSGQIGPALEAFSAAAKFGALSARDENNWGTALAQSGAFEAAVVRFDAATRQEPTFANAWANLGTALEQIGDAEGALEAYREAVRLDPRHRVAARLRALGG